MPGQDHERLASGLADETAIQRTLGSLTARSMEATVVESGGEALEILKELVPPGSEVFFSTSETLDSIGYTRFLHENPSYKNLHELIDAEPDPTKQREMRRLASVAEYYVGSVQAITETGEILVASASGSQIGAYAYGAKHLVLVAGTQKLCPTLSDAFDRVRGYTVEKHDQWLAKRGAGPAPIGKLLIMEKESMVGRVRVVLIKENLGW